MDKGTDLLVGVIMLMAVVGVVASYAAANPALFGVSLLVIFMGVVAPRFTSQ